MIVAKIQRRLFSSAYQNVYRTKNYLVLFQKTEHGSKVRKTMYLNMNSSMLTIDFRLFSLAAWTLLVTTFLC